MKIITGFVVLFLMTTFHVRAEQTSGDCQSETIEDVNACIERERSSCLFNFWVAPEVMCCYYRNWTCGSPAPQVDPEMSPSDNRDAKVRPAFVFP